MTFMPLVRDSATFSAACRQTVQVRKSPSPSFHSFVCLSNVRGVDAIRKLATAAPLGVKRSSGSSTRLPTNVMTVSPAMAGSDPICRGVGRWGGGAVDGRSGRLASVGTDHLGTQHGLVEVELPVEFLDHGRIRGQVDDGVEAVGLLLDLVLQAPLAPQVDLVDGAAPAAHDREELVEGRGDGALVEIRVEDHHQFVLTHS